MKLSDRIRALRGPQTQTAFGSHFGVDQSTVSRWEKGTRPDADQIVALAQIAGVTVDDFLSDMPDCQHPARPTDLRPSLQDDFALVPVYDAAVSAGPGSINDPSPEPIHFSAYRLDWLHRVTNAPADQLAVLRVAGDSMWQTLHNGDHVLVDTSINRFTRDGMYVIRLAAEDEVMVKRMARGPGGTLTVKSDNPDYPTWTGLTEDQIQVVGRVLWVGRTIG